MEFLSLHPLLSSRPRARSLASFIAAAAASLLLVQGAVAADKVRAAPAAPAAPSKTAVLTPAQLRDCMTQKDALRERNEAAVKAKADIVAAKAEIDRTGAEISEALATLDRTNKDAVDAYNAKLLARNVLIDAYQAKGEAFNKDVESIQTTQESYSAACSNRRYDDRDLSDIQKKK
jgi:hypothetical protein